MNAIEDKRQGGGYLGPFGKSRNGNGAYIHWQIITNLLNQKSSHSQVLLKLLFRVNIIGGDENISLLLRSRLEKSGGRKPPAFSIEDKHYWNFLLTIEFGGKIKRIRTIDGIAYFQGVYHYSFVINSFLCGQRGRKNQDQYKYSHKEKIRII